jgi:hypothetical protein
MPGEAEPNSVTQNVASIAFDLSRRDFVATASAVAGGFALAQGSARAAIVRTDIANLPPYGNGTLPPGIRSRSIANVNGLAGLPCCCCTASRNSPTAGARLCCRLRRRDIT